MAQQERQTAQQAQQQSQAELAAVRSELADLQAQQAQQAAGLDARVQALQAAAAAASEEGAQELTELKAQLDRQQESTANAAQQVRPHSLDQLIAGWPRNMFQVLAGECASDAALHLYGSSCSEVAGCPAWTL